MSAYEECGFCKDGQIEPLGIPTRSLPGGTKVTCPYCDGTGKQIPLNEREEPTS